MAQACYSWPLQCMSSVSLASLLEVPKVLLGTTGSTDPELHLCKRSQNYLNEDSLPGAREFWQGSCLVALHPPNPTPAPSQRPSREVALLRDLLGGRQQELCVLVGLTCLANGGLKRIQVTEVEDLSPDRAVRSVVPLLQPHPPHPRRKCAPPNCKCDTPPHSGEPSHSPAPAGCLSVLLL